MAAFYGTIDGSRGPVSRIGSKTSGIKVSAQSWEGSIVVSLYMKNGSVYAEILANEGSTSLPRRGTLTEVYAGSIAELLTRTDSQDAVNNE